MLNGITYTEAEIQSIALHLIELLRKKLQKFENYKLTNYSSKATMDGYFNLTSDVFLKCHSNVEKSEGQTIGQNIRKSDLFYMISTTWDEQEKLGLEGQVALFCSKTLRFLKIEA